MKRKAHEEDPDYVAIEEEEYNSVIPKPTPEEIASWSAGDLLFHQSWKMIDLYARQARRLLDIRNDQRHMYEAHPNWAADKNRARMDKLAQSVVEHMGRVVQKIVAGTVTLSDIHTIDKKTLQAADEVERRASLTIIKK